MLEIPDFEGYKIDEDGNVYSLFLKRFMRQKISNGYKSVGLRKNGKYYWINCHRLCAITYLGKPDGYADMQVCHIDGNKNNNQVSNLKWGTPKENTHDKYAHGTMYNGKKGENHHAAKLTKEIVVMLRMAAETTDCKELSILHKIPKLTIYDAVVGNSWKSVNDLCKPVDLSGRQYKRKNNAKNSNSVFLVLTTANKSRAVPS